MGWRELPYWLRGGIIVFIITPLVFLIPLVAFPCYGVRCPSFISQITIDLLFLPNSIFPGNLLNLSFLLLPMIFYSFIGVIIGVLVGLIYGKIKRR